MHWVSKSADLSPNMDSEGDKGTFSLEGAIGFLRRQSLAIFGYFVHFFYSRTNILRSRYKVLHRQRSSFYRSENGRSLPKRF